MKLILNEVELKELLIKGSVKIGYTEVTTDFKLDYGKSIIEQMLPTLWGLKIIEEKEFKIPMKTRIFT